MNGADLKARWAEIFRPKVVAPPRTTLFEANQVTATMLYSGQGMTNFIQIYESYDDPAPKATALIDFGQGNSSNGPAVARIIELLGEMVAQKLPPKLDLVIISHQDKDHWGLLKGFLDAVEEQMWAPDFAVGEVRFGGADWGTSAERTVGRLAKYSTSKSATPIPANYSNYATANGTIGELADVAGVKFRILACNIAISDERNATSAVVAVDFADNRFVFPGDATYLTMGAINTTLSGWTTNPVPPVYAIGIPHHGALATFTQYYLKDPVDVSVGARFAQLMAGENAVASAGYLSKHSHPVDIVVDTFAPYTAKAGEHPIVVYEWKREQFAERTVAKSVYTLVYKMDPDPAFQDKYFYLIGSPTTLGRGPVRRGMLQPRARAVAPIVAPPPLAAGVP